MTATTARRISFFITLSAILLMAFHLLAPAEPSLYDQTYNFAWGVSFYSRLPFAYQLFGATFLPVTILWAIFAPHAPKSNPSYNDPNSPLSKLWRWLPYGMAILGVLLFTLFPVAYSDGDSNLFNRFSAQRLILEPEPLDYYLKVKLYNLLSSVLTLRTDAFQIVAVIAGFFYVLGSFFLSARLGRTRAETLVLFGGLLTIASIIFYFRYIENYALVSAASVFLIWACVRYIDGNISLSVVAALAMLTALFHGAGLFLFPMLLVAWVLRSRQFPTATRKRQAAREAVFASLAAVAVFALFLSIIILDGYNPGQFQGRMTDLVSKGNGMFIPFFPYSGMLEPFAFFSWSHLGAVIQEQLLVAPLALLTIIIVLALAWPYMRSHMLPQPPIIVISTAAVSLFLYSIFWNPDLGARSDWDLLALPAIPLTILALLFLQQIPEA